MEKFDIFSDIAERTGGSIYVGVVGPVRTGKSTFIKRFMDLLVMPSISDAHVRSRTKDELPQSGAGKTIMTTEPKFVPDEPIDLSFAEGVKVSVRLVDCVGYTVPGAKGYADEEGPRMVLTPWHEQEIPFQEAAEIGTRKVISEHSTLGLVIVTDGSVTDIARDEYLEAEERVIRELHELDKPFLVVLNSTQPEAEATRALARDLEKKYSVTVVCLDCLRMDETDIIDLLQEALFEFPIREINIRLPRWVEELQLDHDLRLNLEESVYEAIEPVACLRDIDHVVERMAGHELVEKVKLAQMDMGRGIVSIWVTVSDSLFYEILSDETGLTVQGNHDLMRLMQDLATAKRQYDKVAGALQRVQETGYGIVVPSLDDIAFEHPELIKQGRNFGIKLTASAPSYHIVRANIATEVTPLVGTEKQGEELVASLTEEFEKDTDVLWKRDFLGKSLQDMVREGIESKLNRMPDTAQEKLQEALTKILNEGSGGLICIIL